MLELLIPQTLMAVGPASLIVIAVVALIIFGPKKLPQFGKAIGSTLKEFKDATKGLATDDDDEKEQPKKVEASVEEPKKVESNS